MNDPDEIDIHELLARRRQIAVVWSIEDVQQVRPDLSDEQSWQVLQRANSRLDAGMGITWHILEYHADHLFGAAPETDEAYTPGPWDYDMDYIVAPDPDGRHPDIYIAEIAHSDDEGRIAPPQQHDANRRLIAAAPDLLESLYYLLEQTVDMDFKYGIGLSEGEEDARAKALAAIAKATNQDCDGRQP